MSELLEKIIALKSKNNFRIPDILKFVSRPNKFCSFYLINDVNFQKKFAWSFQTSKWKTRSFVSTVG